MTRLARLNRDRIPLHTETRLEGITPELADLFREAGFESVEVGLQSIHPEVCAGVGRHLDLESFRRGAAAMKRAGIRLELGIILGLPGDDLDGFTATLQWLADHDLADETVVFILSLLPGTELRARAVREGWHFMAGPPYYLLEGGGWHQASILEALYRMEDILEQSYYPEWLPVIEGIPTTRFRTELELSLGKDDESVRLTDRLPDLAAVLCLRVHMNGSAADLERLKSLGREFSHSNPFSLIRLLIEAPQSLTDDSLAEIRDVFAGEEGYWERLNVFRDRRPDRSRCQIFQVIPRVNPDRFIRSLSPGRDIVWELPDNPEHFLTVSSELIRRDLAGDVYLVNQHSLDEAYQNEIRALGGHRFAGWLSVEGK